MTTKSVAFVLMAALTTIFIVELFLYTLIRYNKIISYGIDPNNGYVVYTEYELILDIEPWEHKNPSRLIFWYWIQESFFIRIIDYEMYLFGYREVNSKSKD